MMLPDGRVQLSLYGARSAVLDRQIHHVDDFEELKALARDWALRDWSEPATTPAPDPDPEFQAALNLLIGARGTSPDFGDNQTQLQYEFGTVFGDVSVNKPRVERPDDVELGRFEVSFAVALRVTHRRLRRLAERRLAGGRYLPVLEHYLEQLDAVRDESQQNFYQREERGLIALLRAERYLMLADDPRVRQLYAAISGHISQLYNWHMDLAKGGFVRSR